MNRLIQTIRSSYDHTILAAYIAYITQAILNNFSPLLFVTFSVIYGISVEKIALIVSFNFGIQLLVDLLASKFLEKIGYRRAVVAAQILAALGLVGLTVFPLLFPPYIGLLAATFLSACGGGLIEVIVSPLVEACPSTGRKEAAMSLLHSFYCWGQVFTVLVSTVFFVLFDISSWRILACLWAVIPAVNAVYFCFVPICTLAGEGASLKPLQLFQKKLFWVLLVLMVCAGACELSISQWASAFAEKGLNVNKTVGDLAGPCAFAVLMGTTRALYAKFSNKIALERIMLYSGVLGVASYLTASLAPWPGLSLLGCALCGVSVGVLWPGTFSLAAKGIPGGGTAMFALLALGGDVGCTIGPALVGQVSEALGENLKAGVLAGTVFPVLLILFVLVYMRMQKKK